MTTKDLIQSTVDWVRTAGQAGDIPDARQVAFYTGMQLEELAEKLTAIFPAAPGLASFIDGLADELKLGIHDVAVSTAMLDPTKAQLMLDADMDIAWVSFGAAAAMASDVPGAYSHVDESNWGKFHKGVVLRDPHTGKVVKPDGWKPADVTPYLHETLRA